MNFKAFILISLLVFISGCVKRSEFKTIHLYMMDTLVQITLPRESSKEFAGVELEMQTLVDFVKVMSNEISSNKDAVQIDEFVYNLLKDEARYFSLSGGRFNSTVITISSLYGFPNKEKSIPDSEVLEEVKGFALGGRVEFWEEDGRYFAKGGGLKIDLSSFAKGAIIDEASDYLKSRGVKNFIINAGGDLYASGLNSGKLWRVGIADPNNRGKYIRSLEISNKGVATSGTNERFFITDNGTRISHLFDGLTGEPSDRYQSVTVIADRSKEADALSTMYFFMTEDDIRSHCLPNNIIVYIVDKDSNLVAICE